MRKYEYARIQTLYNNLVKHGIPDDVISEILAGGEQIRRAAKPEHKADWFKNAVDKMDRLLPESARYSVREDCACCLGGKRLQLSQQIAREHHNLEDQIAAANNTRMVFGHSVKREPDGSITVCFYPDGLDNYRCVCMPKAREPFSLTYCYCCGGHIRHHLQVALGRKLRTKVISSALSSRGKEGCKFSYMIEI